MTLSLIGFHACKTQAPLKVMHVKHLEAGHNKDGFFYALPRTVISVDVKVLKTEHIPGPFAAFAGKYLGLDNVISQRAVNYSIADIAINAFAEPDPDEFYFIAFNSSKQQNSPLLLSLSESGLITGFNTRFDPKEYLKGLPEEREYGFFGSESTFNYFIESNIQERIDTITERVRLDTITVERQTLRRSWVEKPSDVRAKEVADYILKLRQKKFDLISGFAEIPYSKESLKFMHDEMDKLENDYLLLFTGMSKQSYIHYRYTYVPDKAKAEEPHLLFRFSDQEGVLPRSRNDASAVTLEIERNLTTRQLAVFAKQNTNPRVDNHGLYYRIPEHATVIIKSRGTIKADARLLISQFGIITHLPGLNLEAEFFPNTGSIKSVGFPGR